MKKDEGIDKEVVKRIIKKMVVTIISIFILAYIILVVTGSLVEDTEDDSVIEQRTMLASSGVLGEVEERSVEPKGFKSSVNTLNYTKLSEGKAKEISYKDAYNQEGKYLVLYTHEKCKYCMEFWTGDFRGYIGSKGSLPTYVVDLAENSNMVAWDEYDIEGIPYLIVVDSKAEDIESKFKKAIGLKNSEELINRLTERDRTEAEGE